MKKVLAGAAIAAATAMSTAACGGGVGYASANYCVNQMTGQVMPPEYCQVGGMYYNPMLYDFWVGNTYGHSYRVGTVIQHNYFVSGTKVSPSNSAARRAAGLPATGKIGNNTRVGGVPAKSQSGNSRVGSSGTSGTSRSGGSSFGSSGRSSGGSVSRSSGGFGSSRSGGFSSGGRK